jgi:hypothetical protein
MGRTLQILTVIALLLVAAGGVLLWVVTGAQSTAPPTQLTDDPRDLAKIVIPIAPSTVVQYDKPGDCGETYAKAIEDYLHKRAPIDGFISAPLASNIPTVLPFLQPLLDATKVKQMSLFQARPDMLINYRSEHPQLDAIVALGNALVRVTMVTYRDDPQTAMTYAKAAFALGAKMFDERVRYEELSKGLQLMADSAHYISQIANDQGDAKLASAASLFDQARQDYQTQHVIPLEQALSSIDPTFMDAHAGDVIKIASQAKESMWRVEAVLALGRYRYSGRLGDQKTANALVKKLADDEPDPLVKQAAIAARDLTIEQFRMQH